MSSDPFESAQGKFRNRIQDEEGIWRDGYGRYLIVNPATGKEEAFTRATTFAKAAADTYALNLWGRRMTAKGLTLRPDLVLAAAACDVTKDRDRLNKIAEEAADAAAARAGANLGTALHAFSEQVDRGEDPYIPAPWDLAMAAYRKSMDVAGLEIVVEWMEQVIFCLDYHVAGKYDRIVRITKPLKVSFPGQATKYLLPGQLVIADLKTGKDLQYGWGEIAVQLSIYANASGSWDREREIAVPFPPVRKDVGIVMHVPAVAQGDQGDATLYFVDLEAGWDGAALCEAVRAWRSRRGFAVPVGIVEATETATDVHAPTWIERILMATSKADLSAIWREATAAGAWTSELKALGQEKAKTLGN
jgi:hypothetical protein